MATSGQSLAGPKISNQMWTDASVSFVLFGALFGVFLWEWTTPVQAAPSADIVFLLDDGASMSEAAELMKQNCLEQARSVNSSKIACRYAVIPFGQGGSIPSITLTEDFSDFENQLMVVSEVDETTEDTAEEEVTEELGSDGSRETLSDALKAALALEFAENAKVYFYIVTGTSIEGEATVGPLAKRMKEQNVRSIIQAQAEEQTMFRPLYENGGRFFDLSGNDLTEPEILKTAKDDNVEFASLISAPRETEEKEETITARSLYSKFRGQNAIEGAEKDKFGNAMGSQYDLGVDGAFKGLTIAVMQLYTGEGFDFRFPLGALEEKGFTIVRWQNNPPPIDELKETLSKSCQFWLISDQITKLGEEHVQIIKEFFDAGHGVYLWGDNDPYYADANYVGNALLDIRLRGNQEGDRVVGRKIEGSISGIVEGHLISTGLETIYEGISISTVTGETQLDPLVYSSAGEVVVAAHDSNGKRLILDGGFTRLYLKWDTAGTGRYVKNAAAWLVNYERFGDDIFKK